MRTATVVLFKPSGKYYTEERWRIPEMTHDGHRVAGPYDMIGSPDFRRIDGGAVLVETQEPWGYPHLFPQVTTAPLHGEMRRVLLVCPHDDCIAKLPTPDAADCGNHEEWMT